MKKFLLEDNVPDKFILMYSARWCSSCKEMKIRLEGSDLPVYELDVDTTTGIDMAKKNDVKSLPTFFICSGDGKHLDKKYGTMSESSLKEWFESIK